MIFEVLCAVCGVLCAVCCVLCAVVSLLLAFNIIERMDAASIYRQSATFIKEEIQLTLPYGVHLCLSFYMRGKSLTRHEFAQLCFRSNAP